MGGCGAAIVVSHPPMRHKVRAANTPGPQEATVPQALRAPLRRVPPQAEAPAGHLQLLQPLAEAPAVSVNAGDGVATQVELVQGREAVERAAVHLHQAVGLQVPAMTGCAVRAGQGSPPPPASGARGPGTEGWCRLGARAHIHVRSGRWQAKPTMVARIQADSGCRVRGDLVSRRAHKQAHSAQQQPSPLREEEEGRMGGGRNFLSPSYR